ncbi:antibiotic biosynthesis monooxygenase [Streptomyces sp. ST2-7A]|uniref:antibiotic biosynthesis monooxygenase family protein n=1 Tax=Streptomyces sp. ST2-7A TaxID=2907214 RepID=UPI001F41A4DF|nr:antibiotic biosynthesis monooxygenase family protein [Streptomyces sp. ST2-7A]MCE7081094.1 antibiotic biosynthesis monooxygenase [Streptomyces sp. ST2-7A]
MPSDEVNAAECNTITFVNRFTVHGSPEEFERAFADTSAFMVRQPGFLEHTLVRRLGREDQYINIASWTDEESFRAALRQDGFAPHAAALRALSRSENALYRTRQRSGR